MKSIFHEHKLFFVIGITLSLLGGVPCYSEDVIDAEQSEELPKVNKGESSSLETEKPKASVPVNSQGEEPTNTMRFNVRIDGSYSGGGDVSQGFSIPSIRLSAFGQVGKYLDYRLSLGQTREFSTATLAQVLPVEAFVVFNTVSEKQRTQTNLKLKAGLFSPNMNPIWTPDLSYLNLPDFNATHRALFLSREAGAEVTLEAFNNILEVSLGAFNGTGVFAENTNNAKAFTGYVRANIPLQSWNLSIGSGNSWVNQSTEESVNYKNSWVSDLFLTMEIPALRTQFVVDGFASQFKDSIRSISPRGYSAVLNLGFGGWLGLFGRYEYASQSPILSGEIRQFQLGPEIYFDENVKAFLTYTELTGGDSTNKMLTARFRASL